MFKATREAETMRAWEFVTEEQRSPSISLRHINKLKKVKSAWQEKQNQKQALYAMMYTNPANELQHLELQKARIELAQQQADLALTQTELNQENRNAICRFIY